MGVGVDFRSLGSVEFVGAFGVILEPFESRGIRGNE
jgi:hypothetical protein